MKSLTLSVSIKNILRPIRIYLDMDGVLADFDHAYLEADMKPDAFKLIEGVYRKLKPYEGAITGVKVLEDLGFELYVATKIPRKNPAAASEKIYWLEEYIPSLMENVIITPDKGCLGGEFDYLVDDRIHKANVVSFRGTVLHFGPTGHKKNWESLIEFFKTVKKENNDSCLVNVVSKQIDL